MNELQQYATYDQYKQELDQELKKTANSFVRIGFLLKVARDTDILKESKYQNVWDFAKTEYGLDKSQASRFMGINTKFSEGGYSDHLLPKFTDYGSSKLTLMLALPDEIIDELSPTMPKREIGAIAEDYKAEQEVTPIERMLEPKPAGPDLKTDLQKVLYEIGRDNPQMWVDVSRACLGATIEAVTKEIAEIMAPDGEKVYRCKVPQQGRKMVKVDDKHLTITDMRTADKQQYALQDVANAWCYVGTDPTENPYDTWETAYNADFPNRPTPKPVKKEDFKLVQTETEVKEDDEPLGENEGQAESEDLPEVPERTEADPQKPKADIIPENTGNTETEGKEAGPDEQKQTVHLEDQLPGQMEVQDYPELMPENSEEAPKNSEIASVMNPPAAAVSDHTEDDYLVAIRLQSDSMMEYLEAGEFKKAKGCLDTIRTDIWKLEAIWQK